MPPWNEVSKSCAIKYEWLIFPIFGNYGFRRKDHSDCYCYFHFMYLYFCVTFMTKKYGKTLNVFLRIVQTLIFQTYEYHCTRKVSGSFIMITSILWKVMSWFMFYDIWIWKWIQSFFHDSLFFNVGICIQYIVGS